MDLEQFYENTKHLLRPTKSYPKPSPLEAYFHAYSLVSTRAFLIDLYHTLALVPFADILNHCSEHHTSLASDDFVCHICGSLATCTHDSSSLTGVPERLAHLDERSRRKIESEPDSVDMRVERSAEGGEEVMNTYGEGISDSRLLVEWGFVQGEFAGEGISWDLEEVIGHDIDGLHGIWREIVTRGAVTLDLFPDMDMLDRDVEDHHLIGQPSTKDPTMLNVDQEGRISLNIWIAIVLSHLPPSKRSSSHVDDTLIASYRMLEGLTIGSEKIQLKPTHHVFKTIESVVRLIQSRLNSLYRPDDKVEDLLDIRDVRPLTTYLSEWMQADHPGAGG